MIGLRMKKLINFLFPKKKPFKLGDLIRLENSDIMFSVAGFFYDENLDLVMFVQDDNGRIYQVDYRLYVRS